MDNYFIRFKNQDCIQSSLPKGVYYQNQCLSFDNKEPVSIHIDFDLDQNVDFSIQYIFNQLTEVSLIEKKNLNNGATLTKNMTVNDGAIVHAFYENESHNNEMVHVNDHVLLKQDSQFQCGYAELSDGSIQAHFHYDLDGENADAKVRMAILSQNQDDKKVKVHIKHNCPHTYGQMDNYGVVKNEGKLVIDGIGTITKGQFGSSSHQTNKIMVFDEACVASANPYLFIDEYDVKASHAAAVGKMDEEHLYYLQSRGLSKIQAMQLITYGYLKPVIEVVKDEVLKEHFEEVLSKVGA